MVLVNSSDTFSVRLMSLIADYDRDTLVNLYQPLIGHTAVSLYFTLWSEATNQKVTSLCSHETLLARMQLANGDFVKARKFLEGAGLLRTYVEEVMGTKVFYYDLYAPKTPSEFFDDTLLYGLLIKYVGDIDAKRTKDLYATCSNQVGKEITCNFNEVFHPNFVDKAFFKAIKNDPSQGRNRAKLSLDFSYERFFLALKEVSQLSEKAFSKADLVEISRLASLNGADEQASAEIVAANYNPEAERGKRLDFTAIANAFQEETSYDYLSSYKTNNSVKHSFVSSSGAMAQKINMMESLCPKDYLTVLQRGTKPATPDLRLIDYLSSKFKLPNSVLNVVIEYALIKNNNVLGKSYCEKICASLVREDVKTVLDAMNYLNKTSSTKSKPNSTYKKYSSDEIREENKQNNKTQNKKEMTDQEWDQLIEEVEGGENNGKA